MGEVLQSQSIIRLYEYDYDKPPLEDAIIHYGVKGMKWGVRKDKKRLFGSKRRKKREKTYKSNEAAIEAKDLKYIQKHKDKFSTKELNQVMNRIDAETRLEKMAKQSSSGAKGKVKKILNNKVFKAVAIVALAAGAAATYKYAYNVWKRNPRLLVDKQMPKGRQFGRDFGRAIAVGGKMQIERIPGFKMFKSMLRGM